MFFDIIDLKQVIHGLAGMLDPDIVFGKELSRVLVVIRGRVVYNTSEILEIIFFQLLLLLQKIAFLKKLFQILKR